ncbi:unnamed protein product [Camellia sinensis]
MGGCFCCCSKGGGLNSSPPFYHRDTINQILRYASKNRLPESLKEQMLANMQLKFRTAELQQKEVLEDLPKAIRSSIAQHLFHGTVENAYLFKGVSEDLIVQLVSEMKAKYFPPKVDINLQNEIPTDFYILVSGAVVWLLLLSHVILCTLPEAKSDHLKCRMS